MASRRSGSRPRSKALREFVSEVEDVLDQLREGVADLLDVRASCGEADPELVNRMFRSAHSLKGAAGSFGFEALGELAHRVEDLLDALRMGRVALESPAVALLDEATGALAALLAEGHAQHEAASVAAVDLIARIEAALCPPASDRGSDDELLLEEPIRRALTEYEEHRVRENVRRGRHLHLLETTLDIQQFEDGLAELSRAAREAGEVISTLPAPGDAPETEIRFSLLVASGLDREAFRSRLHVDGVSVRCVHEGRRVPEAAPPDSERPLPTEPPPGTGELASLKSISGTVRVDTRKLDELMNLVGELVIQRSAIGALARRLASEPDTARLGAELSKLHQGLDRKLQDLQTSVLDARMVPLAQVFEKLSRVVRRLRRDLGKDVRLEIRGGDTELDKLIVEDLVDPLLHVVRNAFDHAIESAEERRQAGKPGEGCIRIEAFQRGNHVVIRVADDGRGIDGEAVQRKAVERGLLAPDESPSRKRLVEALLAPGFSTRATVTETSGRGVGLDVVRTNVTALGGLLDLDWKRGQGTTVSFTLPITLAIVQALVVRVGGERFAIPLASVLETLLVEPEAIQRSERRELLNLRGEPLVLHRLARAFGLPEERDAGEVHVVVVGIGGARLGLRVDALEGKHDAVVKPIQGPVRELHGIAGATELGGQTAILVLDVSALVEDVVGRLEAA